MAVPQKKGTKKGDRPAREVEDMRCELKQLSLQVEQLTAAISLQNCVETGVDTLTEFTATIQSLTPGFANFTRDITKNLQDIAEHTTPIHRYEPLKEAQLDKLRSIAAQHPGFDLNNLDYAQQWSRIKRRDDYAQSM